MPRPIPSTKLDNPRKEGTKMSMNISIHGRFSLKDYCSFNSIKSKRPEPTYDNANAISMTFEEGDEIAIFNLDRDTAEAYNLLGLLSQEQRKAILPALRHALDIDTADKLDALEEALGRELVIEPGAPSNDC